MFEIESLNRYIDKVRPWPWKMVAGVTIGSFLMASVMSTVLGWWLMDKTYVGSKTAQHEAEGFVPNSGIGSSKALVEGILKRNLFNSEGLTGGSSEMPSGSEIAKSQLAMKVLGIIYGGTPFNGIAMIENTGQGKFVNSFMVGEQISAEATLIEIQRDLILVNNQGRIEFLPLEDIELRRSSRKGGVKKKPQTEISSGTGYATGAPPDSFKEEGFERKGANIELTAEYKNRLLGPDLATVLQDAKASPNYVDGVLKGWRMDQIKAGSFYEKSGMQNGDVAEEINGVLLSDAGQSIKLLKDLKNEGEIDIKINRNGVKMVINLKVR
jgi:type II secretion system protein C